MLRDLGLVTVSFDDELAVQTAALDKSSRPAGLSLGDRACLALAMRESCVALTADRAWLRLRLPVDIELIR